MSHKFSHDVAHTPFGMRKLSKPLSTYLIDHSGLEPVFCSGFHNSPEYVLSDNNGPAQVDLGFLCVNMTKRTFLLGYSSYGLKECEIS